MGAPVGGVADIKPWLVQKYGGTSLGKLLDNICGSIIPSYLESNRVAVVCSALSGTTKAMGTTSLLLKCIDYAEIGATAQAQLNDTIAAIEDNHLRHAQMFLGSSDGDVRREIIDDCEALRRFLLAAQIINELSPRSKDRVISLGEKLAAKLVAACLQAKGYPAKAVILDDIVESVFGPRIVDQEKALESLGPKFFQLLAREISSRIEDCGEDIPVVTGFFGIVPHSLLRTVGRGYSDLCAAMASLGICAEEIQIWKEVDGIFTADPRKVPSARLLSTVTPEEATELTYYGSEVIHPLTMDQIRCANIPLRIKNVFNPKGNGTIIYPSSTPDSRSSTPSPPPSALPSVSFMLSHGYYGDQQERRTPTAVTVKDNILLVNVACSRNTKSQGFLAGVFDQLEQSGVAVDLVTTSERSVSIAVQKSPGAEGASLATRLEAEMSKFGKVVLSERMAIVTVVGSKMRNMVGISGEILGALAEAKINIFMISQGASEINISMVVRAENAIPAMNTIHSQVLKIPTRSERENAFARGPWLY